MPLGLTAEMISAFTQDHARIFFALKAEFASGTLRINSSPYSITIDGELYGPNINGLGRISTIEQDGTLQVRTVTLELAGVPNDKIALAANDRYRGRPASIYFGMLDENFQVIPTPYKVFGGPMDTMASELDEQSSVQLAIGNRLLAWERPRIRRYTDEDQQSEYPGDRGFQYVPTMVEKNFNWGVV